VVSLNPRDFDAATASILVCGKGNKQRQGYLTSGNIEARYAWLRIRGDEPGPLFAPITKGGNITRRRMTAGAVAELLRRLASLAKIARLSPYHIRRTFISDLLDSGGRCRGSRGPCGTCLSNHNVAA
jgi:integrase